MPKRPSITDRPDPPQTGSVFAFHTKPHNAFSPRDTGRYAALVVLGSEMQPAAGDWRLAVALLDGLWTSRPAWDDVAARPLLIKERPGWIRQPAAYGVTWSFDWAPADLRDFFLVGTGRVASEQDRAEAARIFHPRSFVANARLLVFDEMAEGEWRWRHDRATLEAELLQQKAKQEADRLAQEERVRTRLSQLNWDQLLAETPFENWTPSPPYPPPSFALAARRRLHEACRELAALGPKPRKAATRKILRQCVVWFNTANEEAGQVIETQEREDIYLVLEEIAWVAGHPMLAGEIDQWREW